ncbi:MAG: Tab2/Atab2 family RNA-binding protein [Prochloraceae cyanobacterium]
MKIWQADFYRRPLKNPQGENMWELLICDCDGDFVYEVRCLQSEASSDWLVFEMKKAAEGNLPELIQVFRPQSLNLIAAAGKKLGIAVEATRRTSILKEELQKRAREFANYDPIAVEKLPPQGLPENLWGDEWRFGTILAGDIIDFATDRPIPILDLPGSLDPMELGLASSVAIPGVVIYGGRRSMQLARWLAEEKPFFLNYIPTEAGKSGGLILETGLSDRWVFATFEDEQFANAAQTYEDRKNNSQGLHFLIVQPDDSEVTHTGMWLLKDE